LSQIADPTAGTATESLNSRIANDFARLIGALPVHVTPYFRDVLCQRKNVTTLTHTNFPDLRCNLRWFFRENHCLFSMRFGRRKFSPNQAALVEFGATEAASLPEGALWTDEHS
jgi:hypothetical protein